MAGGLRGEEKAGRLRRVPDINQAVRDNDGTIFEKRHTRKA
jgi:hypothetical protein